MMGTIRFLHFSAAYIFAIGFGPVALGLPRQ